MIRCYCGRRAPSFQTWCVCVAMAIVDCITAHIGLDCQAWLCIGAVWTCVYAEWFGPDMNLCICWLCSCSQFAYVRQLLRSCCVSGRVRVLSRCNPHRPGVNCYAPWATGGSLGADKLTHSGRHMQRDLLSHTALWGPLLRERAGKQTDTKKECKGSQTLVFSRANRDLNCFNEFWGQVALTQDWGEINCPVTLVQKLSISCEQGIVNTELYWKQAEACGFLRMFQVYGVTTTVATLLYKHGLRSPTACFWTAALLWTRIIWCKECKHFAKECRLFGVQWCIKLTFFLSQLYKFISGKADMLD